MSQAPQAKYRKDYQAPSHKLLILILRLIFTTTTPSLLHYQK